MKHVTKPSLLLAASLFVFGSDAVAGSWIDFSVGFEDWMGLEQSCGDIDASSALRISIDDMVIYQIGSEEFVFVHDAIGCIDTIIRVEVLYLGHGTDRSVVWASSTTANISISWTSEDVAFLYDVIRPEQPEDVAD